MQRGEERHVEGSIKEIAELLASAYQRHSRIRLISPTSQSIEALANRTEPSVHELTLTRRREEGTPQ